MGEEEVLVWDKRRGRIECDNGGGGYVRLGGDELEKGVLCFERVG